MTVSQKLYVFYKRHLVVRKPETDKLYYPKLFLYRVLRALGLGRIKEQITASTVRVGSFEMRVDPHDSLNLVVNPNADPDEISLLRSHLEPGDTALDVGANIGFYTLHMAQCVGPSGKVIAIEPEPENFDLLEHNVSRNEFDNVELHRVAASSQEGSAELEINRENLGMHRITENTSESETIRIPTVPIEQLVGEGTQVKFVKLDVEGHELEALKGMAAIIEGSKDLKFLIEFNPSSLVASGTHPRDLLEFLSEFGFVYEIAGTNSPVSAQYLLENFPEHSPAYANLFCHRENGGTHKA